MRVSIRPGLKPAEAGGVWPSPGPHKGTIQKVEYVDNKGATGGTNAKVFADAEDEPGTGAILTLTLPNGSDKDEYFEKKLLTLAVCCGCTNAEEEGAEFDLDDLVGAPICFRVKSQPSRDNPDVPFFSADCILPTTYEAETSATQAPSQKTAPSNGAGRVQTTTKVAPAVAQKAAAQPAKGNPFAARR